MNQRRPFKKPFAQEKSRNPERDFSPRKHNGEETTDLGSEKFSSLMREVAGEMGLKDQLDLEPAPLATLDYEKELELKNATLRKFWELHNLPDKPSLVVPSPLPRHYRSTSKRRLYRKGPSWKWEERVGGGKSREDAGILEPAEHAAIYKQALEKLNEEPYRNLANSLNFLILRGAPELMVIFNVFRLNADVVEALRTPRLRALFAEQGADPGALTQAAFTRFVSDEMQKWGKVIATANVKAE